MSAAYGLEPRAVYGAVSYTHLDVYKRQAKRNRKAGFRNRAYSPGTRDVFPVQRLLPVGREVRRSS